MDPLVRLGREVPDFSLTGTNGVRHRLSELRGRLVVLDFWSADCPWSKRADESLAILRREWDDRVVIWRIASNANEAVAQARAAGLDRGMGVVLGDADHALADIFGALVTPHFFVIDRAGILRYTGALDDATIRQRVPARYYLADAVGALLAGRAPDPAETPAYGCAVVRT